MTTEQRLFFDTHGYLTIPNALTPEEVKEANAALDRARERWLNDPDKAGARESNQHQIVGIIEYDDLFLDLMEHPKVFPLVRNLLGDDIQMIDNDAHIKPGPSYSHIGWHFDEALPGVHHPGSVMMVKAFFLLSDVSEDGGTTAFIPGSHTFPNNYPFPRVNEPEEMPGHARMAGKAGDAYFFHGHLYHTALSNHTTNERRVLIYNYGHLFMKFWAGYEPSESLRNRAQTPLRRQLLGMADPYTGRLET